MQPTIEVRAEMQAATLIGLPSTTIPAKQSRLDSVELARGLASLAVCLFHFTKYIWSDESFVRRVSAYGWAGTESFFVISGFIIPFAMHRQQYRRSDFFRFLTKRYLRLAPAYLTAVLLALALWAASSWAPGFQGKPFRFEGSRLVSHLFFANDLLGLEWYNPVFWTLAIEVQYYVAIGIVYPFLFSRIQAVNIAMVAALALSTWLPISNYFVSTYALVFLAGVVLAQWRLNCLRGPAAVILETSILILIQWHHGLAILLATVLTLLLILLVKHVSQLGMWLGQISYALYLTHVPIGGKAINLGMRFADSEFDRWCVLLLALALSILAAQVLWVVIERPSLKWSSRINYSAKTKERG